ncbi:MAG TPA: TetR family transcriptional regulator [Pseudonocardiaceae bacterium]|jgi:AcrR family transcriptional regulator|nr:TetR family transcriptional regulator [Pseudonocardiaceae bacterium]
MPPRQDPTLGRDAEATKARLLAAATEEFAAYGIAGARVDRISAAAKVNKSLIYTYFGNKDQLFDAVMNTHVTRLMDLVPLTAHDLPGYAGLLFDFLLANPHQLRLATWYRLERGGTGLSPANIDSSMREKTAAISAAQAEQVVSTRLAPDDLLVFVLSLVCGWLPSSPHALPGSTEEQVRGHRAAVVAAVRLLVESR